MLESKSQFTMNSVSSAPGEDRVQSPIPVEYRVRVCTKVTAARGLERHAIAHEDSDEEEGYLSERLLGADA